MKRIILSFVLLTCIIGLLLAERDFCGKTVLVVLEPRISEFSGTRNANFFGNFEKVLTKKELLNTMALLKILK